MSPKKSPTRVRRSFTPEFKRDAVRLVEKGKSVTEVARDLGIARSLLQYWKRQLDAEGDETLAPAIAGASEADRLRKLEEELRDVREERDILKKSAGLLRGRPEVKFRFVQEYRETFWVGSMCRVLEVSRSGYYAWRRRQPSLRDRENERLTEILPRRLCEQAPEYHEMSHQQ